MCRTFSSPGAARRGRKKATVTVQKGDQGRVLGREVGWVVVDFDARALRCERCGASHPLKTPTLVDLLERHGEAFQTLHRDCLPPDADGKGENAP
jgi:hypothetical protein